jgi:MFS family permease
LPLHLHQRLGLGTFLVGLVAGSQFAAAIVSRVWAGRHADARSAKHAVIAGLLISAAAGVLYFGSLGFMSAPAISVVILLLGRGLLGVGESFIITGAQTWGLAILGVRNTSKVLAWVGSAMFGAFAVGAPIGTALYARYGFAAIALATTLLPLSTLIFIAPLPPVPSTQRVQAGFVKVLSAVWIPGVASALSSIGFGAMTAFSALLFVGRGWVGAGTNRRRTDRNRLLARLSRLRRGGGAECTRGESRTRDRRLHRVSRRSAWVWHPSSRVAGGVRRS